MSSGNRMTDAQQIAQTVGMVVGAASCCEEVTEERINAVAVRLRELVAPTMIRMPIWPMNNFLLRSKWARLRSRAGGSIPNRQRSP